MNKPRKRYTMLAETSYESWYPADEMDTYIADLARRVLKFVSIATFPGDITTEDDAFYAQVRAELTELAKEGGGDG